MSAELAFAKQEIESLKRAADMQRSSHINVLIDLQVMLQDGDHDEALEILNELLDEE